MGGGGGGAQSILRNCRHLLEDLRLILPKLGTREEEIVIERHKDEYKDTAKKEESNDTYPKNLSRSQNNGRMKKL